jgi:hypothetical protein
MVQGPQYGDPAAQGPQPGKQLAEIHSWDSRADGGERSAVLRWGVRLRVPGFKLAWAAPHPKEDHRRVRDLRVRTPGGEQISERQAAQGQGPDPEKGAAVDRTGTRWRHREGPERAWFPRL